MTNHTNQSSCKASCNTDNAADNLQDKLKGIRSIPNEEFIGVWLRGVCGHEAIPNSTPVAAEPSLPTVSSPFPCLLFRIRGHETVPPTLMQWVRSFVPQIVDAQFKQLASALMSDVSDIMSENTLLKEKVHTLESEKSAMERRLAEGNTPSQQLLPQSQCPLPQYRAEQQQKPQPAAQQPELLPEQQLDQQQQQPTAKEPKLAWKEKLAIWNLLQKFAKVFGWAHSEMKTQYCKLLHLRKEARSTHLT